MGPINVENRIHLIVSDEHRADTHRACKDDVLVRLAGQAALKLSGGGIDDEQREISLRTRIGACACACSG